MPLVAGVFEEDVSISIYQMAIGCLPQFARTHMAHKAEHAVDMPESLSNFGGLTTGC
jgi:hypothetical protein